MTSATNLPEPVTVKLDWVLRKCEYFIDTQLWPPRTQVDPRGWLENFLPDEMDHAAHLLNAVVYLSEPLVDRLFASAFHGLTRHIGCPYDRFPESRTRWQRFLDEVYVTPVTGESPGPTDSGNLFARKARKLIGLPDERILDNAVVIEEILSGTATEVVFVDDFVGSGNQLFKTWHRVHHIASTATSFADVSRAGLARFYYCPIFCTQYALEKGLRSLRGVVRISAAHVLPEEHSLLSPNSIHWPPALRPTAAEFLRRASARARLPDTGGAHVRDWRGFHGLGLAVAFSHGVPDATVPIFYTNEHGWKSLFRSP